MSKLHYVVEPLKHNLYCTNKKGDINYSVKF